MTNDPYEGLELLRNNYPIMEPFGLQTPNSFSVATPLAQGLPSISAPTIPSSGIEPIPGNIGFEGYPKHLDRGYIESWNLTLQKELGWGFTGQAAYVGTRSVRQLGSLIQMPARFRSRTSPPSRSISNGGARQLPRSSSH